MKLRSVFSSSKKWKSNMITVSFEGKGPMRPRHVSFLSQLNASLDPLEHTLNDMYDVPTFVKTVIRERIAPLVGIDINFIDMGGDIRIVWGTEDKGTWSYVGTDNLLLDKDVHTMHLAWIDVFTVIHEFMHALGFEHEHQNPTNNPIEFDLEKVREHMTALGWSEDDIKYNITDRVTDAYTTDFDLNSIMLYQFDDDLMLSPVNISFNTRLSMLDIESLTAMYPGGDLSPKVMYNKIYNMESVEDDAEPVEVQSNSTLSNTANVGNTAEHMDNTTENIDNTIEHIDNTAENIDNTAENIDNTAEHIDNTAEHIDNTAVTDIINNIEGTSKIKSALTTPSIILATILLFLTFGTIVYIKKSKRREGKKI